LTSTGAALAAAARVVKTERIVDYLYEALRETHEDALLNKMLQEPQSSVENNQVKNYDQSCGQS